MPTELTESTNHKELIAGSDTKKFLSAEQTWYVLLVLSNITSSV